MGNLLKIPDYLIGAIMEKAHKTVNYTAEQTALIIKQYAANPSRETVEDIAKTLGKSVRSIIAKLSREQVYIKPESKTESGEVVKKKNDTADAIGAVLRMSKNDIESLTKANKTALSIIWKALCESKPI
jgi:K+/H+ antiporter YhaU regulatory subunit KhtT